ncbi:MAG: hypothetical protein ABIT37_05165 [Luteolibacter sp.]
MKTHTYSLFAAIAATGMAFGAETAYTTPVGYMTIPLPGTGGSTPQKLQLANQGLLPNGPAYAGGGTAAVTFSGNTLTDTTATFGTYTNAGTNSHVLEITSAGSVQGALSWITTNTATSITTADNLSSAGTAATYRVWQAYTMSSLFGNPPAASVLGGGTDASTADNVQILDPTTNTYTSFFYQNAGKGGLGWKSSDSGILTPATYAIHPNDGLVILRKQSLDGALVISGSVKAGATKAVVEGNGTSTVLNILANQLPVDQLTLGASGLYTGNVATGLKGGTDATTADNLLIFNATANSYTTFFYQDSGKGGLGWKSSDSGIVDPTNYKLPATGALLIQRKAGSSFNWTIPSVTVAP